jgi:glutathione-regulated potassium-efflux system ancillary protein KefF
MILIIYAHPYPQHSHANKRMLEQARTLDGVEIRSLYQLYPDFNIDVAAEQAALARAELIIWQHPMQWYSVPPLMKLWMDKVLSHGWAYGHNGIALRGKSLMWAVTTGGGESHFDIGAFPGLMCFPSRYRRPAVLWYEVAAAFRHALHLYLRR